MNDDNMLDFVKVRLEEGEGISPESLSRILAVAERPVARTWNRRPLGAMLVAASLALAACGWFFAADFADACRERNLTDVLDLLCAVDGEPSPSPASLPDYLLAWQDAPTRLGLSACHIRSGVFTIFE